MAQANKLSADVGQLNILKNLSFSSETLAGAGGDNAISTDVTISYLNGAAGTANLTLGQAPAGTVKILFATDVTNASTLDNGDVEGGLLPTTTLTFDSAADSVILVSRGSSGWAVVCNNIA